MDRHSLGSLTAGDATVALRSLPRRFREQFRPGELAGAPDAIDVAAAPPQGGLSPLDLLRSATAALTTLGNAMSRALDSDNPAFDASLLGTQAAPPHPGSPAGVASALEELTSAVGQLAARVERTPLRDWDRPATAGGSPITAIELLREAVARARTDLDQLGVTLESLRRSS